MNKTEERVKRVVYDQLGPYGSIAATDVNSAEDIKKQHSFVDDLGADSLGFVEVIMALEEEFDTEIPDEVSEQWKTVGDVIGYFEAKA